MKVSFVIPFHNDFRYFAACLRSISKQDYPDFETIVVHDDIESRAKTFEICNIHGAKYIGTDKCKVGKARQKGVGEAEGEIIAFIDSDCILPDRHWLTDMMAYMHPGVDVVWTLGNYHEDDPAIMRYAIMSNPYTDDMVPGTGHTLIRKSSIEEAGGFKDIHGGEDQELIKRLMGEFMYAPGREVYHYTAVTFLEYVRKYYNNNYTLKQAVKEGHQLGNPPAKIPLMKYRGKKFLKALFAREDPAWLLWPFADAALLACKLYIKGV